MPETDLEKQHLSTGVRLHGGDEVQYFHVGDREKVTSQVPNLLRSPLLKMLGMFPKSGLQFLNPIEYQLSHLRENGVQHLRFGVVFTDKFPFWLAQITSAPALLRVLLWHTTDTAAINALLSFSSDHVVFPGTTEIKNSLLEHGVAANRLVESYIDVVRHIERSLLVVGSVTAELLAQRKSDAQKFADQFHRDFFPRKALPFSPLRVNLDQLAQLFAQFRDDLWEELPNEHEKRASALAQSFQAVQRALEAIGCETNIGPYGVLPSAVVAFPTFHPSLKESLARNVAMAPPEQRDMLRDLIALRLAEQDSTSYRNFIEPKSDLNETVLHAGVEDVIAYAKFIDVAGTLHASFKAAPYLRAPMKGQSLAQDHSFFSPKNFNQNSSPRAIRRRVFEFGRTLGSALHADVRAAIRDYPGGIVAMTDLPLEWLDVDGVPLGFAKDVCRLPETLISSLLSQFTHNATSTFEVTAETPKRTLVVCGAPDGDPIARAFEGILEMHREKAIAGPWRLEKCASVDTFCGMVNEFRPELLIIDSHGRYQSNERGTEIQFGREYLNGSDVVSRLPQIPLVVMSACWGAPLYGSSNTIAQAFFEAGTFAVTCALLPLNVVKGSVLYTRLLRNLGAAAENPYHPHWSSFVSHAVRTSYLTDLHAAVHDGLKIPRGVVTSNGLDLQSQWFVKTMNPQARPDAFREAYDVITRCYPTELTDKVRQTLAQNANLPEFMYYTTLGRADLVQFHAWNRKWHQPAKHSISVGEIIKTEQSQSA